MKNFYVITCNHGKNNLVKDPYTIKDPFCDSLSDTINHLMNLVYQVNVFSI